MQIRSRGRRAAAVVATAGLVTASLGFFGATAGAEGPATPTPPEAGSVSQGQNDCEVINPQGGENPIISLVTTLAGQSPDTSLYPTGAAAGYGGALTVTIPPEVIQSTIAGLPPIPGLTLDNIGVRVRSVEVLASNSAQGGFTVDVATPDYPEGRAGYCQRQLVHSPGSDHRFGDYSRCEWSLRWLHHWCGRRRLHHRCSLQPDTSLTADACVVNNQDGVLDPGEAEIPVSPAPVAGLPLEFFPGAPQLSLP